MHEMQQLVNAALECSCARDANTRCNNELMQRLSGLVHETQHVQKNAALECSCARDATRLADAESEQNEQNKQQLGKGALR